MSILTSIQPRPINIQATPPDIRLWRDTAAGFRFGVRLSCDIPDYSFKSLYGVSDQDTQVSEALTRKLTSMGVAHAFAPTPGFNAVLIEPGQFNTWVPLSTHNERCGLMRNKAMPADAIPLHYPGDGFVMSAGGCPIGVAAYNQELVAFHAGRESILDPHRIAGLGTKRWHESVADTVMDYFRRSSAAVFDPSKVEVWVFGSIKPELLVHHFAGFEDSSRNKALAHYAQRYEGNGVRITETYVSLDLPKILRQQFLNLGVSFDRIHVDEDCTYLPDEYPYTRHKDPARRGHRYFIGVVRKQ